jgi:hypothetical protein
MTLVNVPKNLIEALSIAMEKMKDFHMWYSNKPKAAPCGIHR